MSGQELEFTEYISPDGQTYRFDNRVDRFLMSETGYGMPPIEYLARRGPQQHGSTIYDYRLAQRVIQLVERQNACSRSEYYAHRADILNMLRPNRQAAGQFELGTLRKGFPDGSYKDIDVLIEEGPIFAARDIDTWDEWAFTEAIRFIAPDPTFYNPVQQVVPHVVAFEDHLIFPFSFDGVDLVFSAEFVDSSISVTYNGTWITYPVIAITGPLDGVIIRNETTSETIHLNYSVSTDVTVTLNLEYGNKTVVDGAGHNLIGVVSSDSDLSTFHIAPAPEAAGGVNVLTVTGGGAVPLETAVTVSYYERYIGF